MPQCRAGHATLCTCQSKHSMSLEFLHALCEVFHSLALSSAVTFCCGDKMPGRMDLRGGKGGCDSSFQRIRARSVVEEDAHFVSARRQR